MADFAHIISLLHEVALLLFTKFLPGDEFYAHDLLSTVLLNSRFLWWVNKMLISLLKLFSASS